MEYFKELLYILNAMSPYLLLGFLIAGLLHVYVPKSTYSRYLSKRGFRSVFLAALFGVPLPLCSCGVIPTAMSLKKEGASSGATVSFLIATPQTGVDSILATYGVLGLPFAILRPIVALIVALFGGMATDRFAKQNGSSMAEIKPSCCSAQQKKLNFVDALKYGFVDMLQDLGGWLVMGLIVAAAITVFVPLGVFEFMAGHYVLNILIVLLFSVPMYVCSTGSIPIALSLVVMGVSPGAALVFLMAGPATNVATLTVVRKVLGGRTTLIYLLSIILGAIAFALLVDFVLPSEWFTVGVFAMDGSTACHEGSGVEWWQVASTIVFVVMLVAAYILKFTNKGTHHSHTIEVEKSATHHFKVEGMRCNHCKANVEKAISSLSGAIEVNADLVTGIVEVQGEVKAEEVFDALSALGFGVDRGDF